MIINTNVQFKADQNAMLELECLMRLAERLNINKNADKLYYLLTRNDLIYEKKFTNENYLISNAKRSIRKIGSSTQYKKALEAYEKEKVAIYEVIVKKDEKSFVAKNNPSIAEYKSRLEKYDEVLDGKKTIKPVKGLSPSDYKSKYKIKIDSENEAIIKFEELKRPCKKAEASHKHKKGGSLNFSMDKILDAAQRLDDIEDNREDYRKKVLLNNIYKISEDSKEHVNEYLIDGVVNMAGQVGAGKSTFADALTLVATDEDYRICMVLDTVSAVLKKAELFKKAGLNVGILIGESGKETHFKNQIKGVNCPSKLAAETLQGPCLLNGLNGKTEDFNGFIKYGKEPCFSLKKVDQNGKEIDTKNYRCAYYNFCPKTEQSRNIENADIVLTTVAGFFQCKFGKNKTLFFNYAVDAFDLIIVDESDNLLCQVDNIFAPTVKCREYTKNANPYDIEYRNLSLIDQINSREVKKSYLRLLRRLHEYTVDISEKIKEETTGWPKSILKNFSALKLLKKLDDFSDKNYIKNTLEYMLKKGDVIQAECLGESGLDTLINEIYINTSEDIHKDKIKADLRDLGETNIKKLTFILETIILENIYNNISYIVSEVDDIPEELKSILSGNVYQQQKLLPNSPLGNIFGMELRDEEFYIKKINALGRAAFLKMPYLDLSENGSKKGPNILLMSGTGYIPGAYRFHVSDNVDYIIEATEDKREFIKKTKISNLRSDNRVSGTKLEDRNKALINLIHENEGTIEKCIKNGEKILMIVNSYEQCDIACKEIKKIIDRKNLEVNAKKLTSDSDENIEYEDFCIKRSDITKFEDDILVAPACVIERGHNIVDSNGNAWFNTLMFLVRPMSNPSDIFMQLQMLHGYLMNKYANAKYDDRIKIVDDIRKDAYNFYTESVFYGESKLGLKVLPDNLKKDVIASLFVIINQVFGRLCRVNNVEEIKSPSIYWVDGAFNSSEGNSFDTVKEMENYLKEIIEQDENLIVAETLYGPLYEAMKGTDR